MLTLHQIRKRYYNTLILDIPLLELPPGIFWIQGGNGAGKTTCLKIMAGLIPFEGDVRIQGAVSSKQHPIRYRQLVNYAEAEPLYPPFVTGRDLLRLHTGAKGHSPWPLSQLAGELGVDDFLHKPVSTYSSGMLKKLSLLLAFAGAPLLVLLDEPLITLDSAAMPVLCRWIRTLHAQYDVSCCLTSHQPVAAEELPLTKALVIEHHQIVFR